MPSANASHQIGSENENGRRSGCGMVCGSSHMRWSHIVAITLADQPDRQCGDPRGPPEPAQRPRDGEQQHRHREVEADLDHQRPGGRDDAAEQLGVVRVLQRREQRQLARIAEHGVVRDDQHDEQHDPPGGQDAQRPRPDVARPAAAPVVDHVVEERAGDQEPGEHEERGDGIHAHVVQGVADELRRPLVEPRRRGRVDQMERHHRHGRECAKAVEGGDVPSLGAVLSHVSRVPAVCEAEPQLLQLRTRQEGDYRRADRT